VRGVGTGAWDAREKGWAQEPVADFGVLRLPHEEGDEYRIGQVRGGTDLASVALRRGGVRLDL